MKKKTPFILVIVMATAMIGIMVLQLIWLNRGIEENKKAFAHKVHLTLIDASKMIRENEQQILYSQIDRLSEHVKKMPKKQSFSIVKEDPEKNQFYVYKQEALVEESVIPLKNKKIGRANDSLSIISEYSAQLKKEIPKISGRQTPKSLSPVDYELLTGNNLTIDRYIRLKGSSTPIEKRVSKQAIDSILKEELQEYNLNTKFEFAVLKRDSSITKIVTKNFKKDNKTYYSSLFFNDKGKRDYLLSIYFPKRDEMVKGPIMGQFLLAALLMIIVLSVFGVSLYYIRMQRKNSEIKSDFVNNMTHEFKTPIATIAVAVSALKNKNVLNSEEKIKHYTKLIKQQNERLNAQVEMVLRMSRLERNQIGLDLQKIDLNEIVRAAVDEIRLIIQDRKGKLTEKYSSEPLMVRIDAFHLKNVILNVLDNANKYSPATPKVKIEVFREKNRACVMIEDRGIGMSSSVQKRIFETFYREETGNIHNIKGHGLGLSYLKKIIDLHRGEVIVKSEKGKGSKFFIKIPI